MFEVKIVRFLAKKKNFDLGTFVDTFTNSLANFADGNQDGNGATNGDMLRILSNALRQIDVNDSRYINLILQLICLMRSKLVERTILNTNVVFVNKHYTTNCSILSFFNYW